MEFKVALSSASAKTVSVAFATADTGATAGVDYQTAAGTLTFARARRSNRSSSR